MAIELTKLAPSARSKALRDEFKAEVVKINDLYGQYCKHRTKPDQQKALFKQAVRLAGAIHPDKLKRPERLPNGNATVYGTLPRLTTIFSRFARDPGAVSGGDELAFQQSLRALMKEFDAQVTDIVALILADEAKAAQEAAAAAVAAAAPKPPKTNGAAKAPIFTAVSVLQQAVDAAHAAAEAQKKAAAKQQAAEAARRQAEAARQQAEAAGNRDLETIEQWITSPIQDLLDKLGDGKITLQSSGEHFPLQRLYTMLHQLGTARGWTMRGPLHTLLPAFVSQLSLCVGWREIGQPDFYIARNGDVLWQSPEQADQAEETAQVARRREFLRSVTLAIA